MDSDLSSCWLSITPARVHQLREGPGWVDADQEYATEYRLESAKPFERDNE